MQAWLADRENRIVKKIEPPELTKTLEESLGALATKAIAQVNDSQDPFELAHKRLLIESLRGCPCAQS